MSPYVFQPTLIYLLTLITLTRIVNKSKVVPVLN
jgi:hypothetical protein